MKTSYILDIGNDSIEFKTRKEAITFTNGKRAKLTKYQNDEFVTYWIINPY